MANLASALKEEISRHARKELKGETEGLKKASSRYRSDIAEMKRKVVMLEQRVAKLEKLLVKATHTVAQPDETAINARFSAAGLKKLRDKLELSAATLGSILGTSLQTIYNWETGKTRPNKEQIVKIAILRKMGKREVKQRLEMMRSAK